MAIIRYLSSELGKQKLTPHLHSMHTTKTQQLLKHLALDFIHNKSFNPSILQLLCNEQQIHASTTSQSLKAQITIIDKTLLLLKQHCQSKQKNTQKGSKPSHNLQSPTLKNFFHMANILIFNISAINEHYINQIQKQMAESTASQSNVDLNKTFYKDKLAIGFLRQQLQTYFILLTEQTTFFTSIVSDIEAHKTTLTQSELGLLQTMDYLCVKYSISNQFTERVVGILEKNQNQMEESSFHISPTVIKDVNHMLFSSERQSDLYQVLEMNSHVSFKNVINLINANYMNTHPQRKIFSTSQLSGKQAIEGIIIRLIKRIGKNELFNEKSQDYTPLRLILFYFLNKHYSVYMQFNEIVKSLMNNLPLNSQAKLNTLKKIQRVFRILIPIQTPHFCNILQFIHNNLSAKYSETLAFQLIKKLLLNRFLLNPSFYILYNDPDEEEIKQYVEAANLVRALFYSHKTQQLAQKTKCSQLIKISSEIVKSLESCLKKDKDSRDKLQGNSNFLYVNDKIIKGQMQQFFDEAKETMNSPREPLKQGLHLPNLVSDYSLSFSLVKNEHPSRNNLSHPVIQNVSQVKFPTSNRSNNLRDNQSIRYMYEQLKGQKSQNQIPPKSPQKSLKPIKNENKQQKKQQNYQGFGRVSQMARKQHEITNQTRLYSMKLPTDRQMIEELVEMRKQYGQYRRGMKKQLEERKLRHNKKMGNMRALTARFSQYKEEIQKDNNSLYVHMTTYA